MPSHTGTAALLVALVALALPSPAWAQLGAIEAFARNVTDMSFFVNGGDLLGGSDELTSGDFGLTSFGVELLFSVGEVTRPVRGARVSDSDPATERDSVRLVWKSMEVTRSDGVVDTVYHYEVEAVPPPEPVEETIWFLEVGIGYGQIQGFEMKDPSLDIRGAVRDLPAVSLYASYEPTGTYAGLRTGFMKTQGLQLIHSGGEVLQGDADAFFVGALVGQAKDLGAFILFAESGYAARYFPSVEWDSDPLPAGTPRDLGISGWYLGTGVQFAFR